MRINKITYPDVNNGVGFRVTIWVSGCVHHCRGCHNPETWDFNGGREFTEDDKKKIFELIDKPYMKGVTFSGGDPLCSYSDVLSFAKELKEKYPDKDIWIYTGYVMEYVKENMPEILKYTDYMVDGEYHDKERDLALPFRGSRNQNIWKKNKESGEFEIFNFE